MNRHHIPQTLSRKSVNQFNTDKIKPNHQQTTNTNTTTAPTRQTIKHKQQHTYNQTSATHLINTQLNYNHNTHKHNTNTTHKNNANAQKNKESLTQITRSLTQNNQSSQYRQTKAETPTNN